jgi:predicted nucleic acid-binding protein
LTALYLDSSAIVKLIVAEPESDALLIFLKDYPLRASSMLARVEVKRAVRGRGPQVLARAETSLERLHLLHLDEPLLEAAAALGPPVLRTLDAIHLASAQTLGDTIVVTYDARMAEASASLGLRTLAPR